MALDDATLWELSGDKTLRHRLAFVAFARGLARQIHLLRQSRRWSQKELARRAGLSVMTVMRYEQWCGHARISNLIKIANAFDVALIIRFVSWGDFFLTVGRSFALPKSFDEEQEGVTEVGGEMSPSPRTNHQRQD